MKKILAPSILAADFGKLADAVREVADAGAEYIHIDVMDGMFVPSISLGMPVIQSIRSCTDKVFDVHMMVEEPGRYAEASGGMSPFKPYDPPDSFAGDAGRCGFKSSHTGVHAGECFRTSGYDTAYVRGSWFWRSGIYSLYIEKGASASGTPGIFGTGERY